jgi:hypothetical protein
VLGLFLGRLWLRIINQRPTESGRGARHTEKVSRLSHLITAVSKGASRGRGRKDLGLATPPFRPQERFSIVNVAMPCPVSEINASILTLVPVFTKPRCGSVWLPSLQVIGDATEKNAWGSGVVTGPTVIVDLRQNVNRTHGHGCASSALEGGTFSRGSSLSSRQKSKKRTHDASEFNSREPFLVTNLRRDSLGQDEQ